MKKVRTRFAPSPTGRMHVGNLRTALYAYLIARHHHGDFILRIEDTDQQRFAQDALEIIYRTLEQTGLQHDEGPDKDGGFGPYVQSERMAQGLYLRYAKQLIEKGEAYYCFCKKERLDTLKEQQLPYDKHCLSLSKEEIEANLASGVPYVIRQKNPNEGTTTFTDIIFGEITVENTELDDMILIKSDGYPTYNFANVIDDHLMEITHVVRGSEYLSSTPKYNRLYQAFGWEPPVYVHCPIITNEEHKKLSKRCGHASYEDLIAQGFVTEAVLNYVALLGWSPAGNEEIFSLKQLEEIFEYEHINKSPAVFDLVKLRWMNGEYIKKMEEEPYLLRAMPEIKKTLTKQMDFKKIAGFVKTRIETFAQIAEQIDFLEELPVYGNELYENKKMKSTIESSNAILQELYPLLEQCDLYEGKAIEDVVKRYIAEKGYKNGQVLWPLRIAVSGKRATPCGAYEIMELIGKTETLGRMKQALQQLQGV